MWCLVLLPVRRPVYFSLLLLLVLIHLTSAYSVEEICARRCLYHRGGVLCNCNAMHFTGKRSGLAADSNMYSAESARQGQLSQFSLENIGNDDSVVPESVGTLGHRHLISRDLQQKIRGFWDHRRLGDILTGQEQHRSYTIDTDDENEDNNENTASSQEHDDRPMIVVHSDISDDDNDNEQMIPVAAAIDGRHDTVQAGVVLEKHLGQLEAALRRAWHGRGRHGLV